MPIALEFTQEAEAFFEEDFLQEIASRTMEEVSPMLLRSKHLSVNAIAVSQEKIENLNRTYRGKDSVTDILSFGEYTGREAIENDENEEMFLGELFFCPDFIKKAAREDGISFEHEMIYVFSHGILHLLGFDHSDEMFSIQDKVTENLVLKFT